MEPVKSLRMETSSVVWSHHRSSETDVEATYALLDIRSEDEIIDLFEDPRVVQKSIWEKIANMMSDLGRVT